MAAEQYNPYEGNVAGRQLSESVDEFLARLPPATTPISQDVPWITVANPYRERPRAGELGKGQGAASEAPTQKNSDWKQFTSRGYGLLEELTHFILETRTGPPKTPATQNIAIKKQRDVIVKKLQDTATDLHCTTGKVSNTFADT